MVVPAKAVSVTAGPVSGQPSVVFTANGQLSKKLIPMTVAWPVAAPDGAPIARYELQRNVDSSTWTAVALAKPLARKVDLKVQPWTVLRFRVRAVDTASAAGDWVEAAPSWITVAQESDSAIDLSAGWSAVGDSAAFGRRRATATANGETAAYSFTGRQVAWVASFGPNRGTADAALDGAVTAVNLTRNVASSRRIAFSQSWPTGAPHSLTLTTTSTAKSVDVDAFLVLSDPTIGTIVGAGDISSCSSTHDSDTAAQVSAVLVANSSATAFTAGDNVYPSGSTQSFANCYDPSWGIFKTRTRPAPGNHDYYQIPDAAPYFAYFGANAGPAGLGWYRYESGTWRIYALNSECGTGSTCFATQLAWLKADLAAEPHHCVLAMWHRPVFSTGPHGSSPRMAQVFQLLYDNGADIVIAGHDHGYQRFAPANPSGSPDAANGIREFVAGTGGAELYSWKTDSGLLEVRGNTSFGVLRLDLAEGGYSWDFESVPGSTGFSDTGSGECH